MGHVTTKNLGDVVSRSFIVRTRLLMDDDVKLCPLNHMPTLNQWRLKVSIPALDM